jgi:hypothetical protein
MNGTGARSPVGGGLDRSREPAWGTQMSSRVLRVLPPHVVRVPHRRLIPPVVVQLGELLGLIYRADKARAGGPRAYIHIMRDPPRLVSNVEGTQIYVVGGSYRVTGRGIEG